MTAAATDVSDSARAAFRYRAAFRDEVTSWLATNAPRAPLPSVETTEGFEAHRRWERTLFEAGLAAVHWPIEYGGRGLDPISTAIFEDAYFASGAPERLNIVGLHICGPTIIEFGTEEQKSRYLPDLLACRAMWSQGFSEPGAGSDLASLRTAGVVDGDVIRVTGQKVWTSLGKWSDHILALVRTDQSAPKHRGITMLIIDSHAPGVTIRPIRQLTGEEGFCEVFLDEVVVPCANVIGPLHGGWDVAMHLLSHERGPGVGTPVRYERLLVELWRIATERGLADDPYWRQQLAQHEVDTQVYRMVWERDVQLRAAGDYPLALACGNKILWTELDHRIHETAWAMFGAQAELVETSSDSPAHDGWMRGYWHSRANMIAAGTNEIQRNVIASRGLGLRR